jgi:hypothetical protein
MGIPEPGTKKYDEMIDYMRADLESGMQYTKLEVMARKIIEKSGRDFDEEFAKWKKERRAK